MVKASRTPVFRAKRMASDGTVAEFALAEDLHADDAFAVGAHLLDDLDDGGGVGVHVGASGIEADEIDFDPR